MPATMYLVFVGLLIPFICLVTFGYRAALINFCVRDACYKAAKSPNFTQAQTNGKAAWNADQKLWTGVSGTITIMNVTKPLSGKETTSLLPLKTGTIDRTANLYFIRTNANVTIHPLFESGKWLGLSIPGFTIPFNTLMTYQYYCENPDGLTQ